MRHPPEGLFLAGSPVRTLARGEPVRCAGTMKRTTDVGVETSPRRCIVWGGCLDCRWSRHRL
jgi:hypothetical protein